MFSGPLAARCCVLFLLRLLAVVELGALVAVHLLPVLCVVAPSFLSPCFLDLGVVADAVVVL